MKKFRFSMESVKTYKEQLLDGVKAEYASRLALVHRKEQDIAELEDQQSRTRAEITRKNAEGISVSEASDDYRYIDVLSRRIEREKQLLLELVRQAEEKQNEMIELKKDTWSLERLKEKRLSEYRMQELKEHETFVEEFVVHQSHGSRRSLR